MRPRDEITPYWLVDSSSGSFFGGSSKPDPPSHGGGLGTDNVSQDNLNTETSIEKIWLSGKYNGHLSEDYFLTSKYIWNWNDIPDFIVGRQGYDNWLVDNAYHK